MVGPEVYHIQRVREGGTGQNGSLTGVKISIERIMRHGAYFGIDYLYAEGGLIGSNATGRPLLSELTDEIVEMRCGFTLQQNDCRRSFITPFAGWGHFREVNAFSLPSPIPCKFTDTFDYVVVGFLSGVNITRLLSIGINFKLRFMQNGTSEVSDDPIFDRVTLQMQEEIHARLDIPLLLFPRYPRRSLGCLFSPFFEYRHFGGREGFPFNFRYTKFYLHGARFALIYRF